MSARRMSAGFLVEPALTVAMEGAAIRVMIGMLLGEASSMTRRIQPIGLVKIFR
jgi:hypothetical protein